MVAVLGAIAWQLFSYDPAEFHGAAPMRDTGMFTYFRYHAALGEIPLAAPGTYALRFSGMPATKMGLQFYVPGGSDANRKVFENLTTEITAEIVDSRGNVICFASGTPLGTDASKRWMLMSSLTEAAYWHESCRSASFERRTDYTLRVGLRNVDPRSPGVVLRAMLEGGGIELS
jgi:hypothetical protein